MFGIYCGVNILGFEGYCGWNLGCIMYVNYKKNKMRNLIMNKKLLMFLIVGLLGSILVWV